MSARWSAVVLAAQAALLTGCGDSLGLSDVGLDGAAASIHTDEQGTFLDGTVNLHVKSPPADTETWLVSLALSAEREGLPTLPLPDVVAEPVSSFPLRAAQGTTATGSVRFRSPFPLEPGLIGHCRATTLSLGGFAFDTASQSSIDDEGGTMQLTALTVSPVLDPPPASPLDVAWAFAESGGQAWSLAVDADGGALITGIKGPQDGSGPFAAKIAPDGSPAWALPVYSESDEIVLAAGGPVTILTGRFARLGNTTFGDESKTGAFAARLDQDGKASWVVTIPPGALDSQSLGRGIKVAVGPDGDVLMGFDAIGPVSLQGTDLPVVSANDVVLMRLDATGTLRWARRFAGSISGGNRLAIDDAGRAIAAVGATATLDLGGGPIAITSPTTVVFASDPAGQLLWAQTWGSAPSEFEGGTLLHWLSLATDSTGSVIVLGQPALWGVSLAQGISFREGATFLAKLSPSGAPLWATAVPAGNGGVFSLAVDDEDRPLVVGDLRAGEALGTLSAPEDPMTPGAVVWDGYLFEARWTSDGSAVDATALGCTPASSPHIAFRRGASAQALLHATFHGASTLPGAQIPAGGDARVVASFRH